MTHNRLPFLLSYTSFLSLCWVVVLRVIPFDWLTGLFFFVLLLCLAVTGGERGGRK